MRDTGVIVLLVLAALLAAILANPGNANNLTGGKLDSFVGILGG